MISTWFLVVFVVLSFSLAFYLFLKTKADITSIQLYKLQIENCEKLFTKMEDICLEHPGTEYSFYFIATKYLKNVTFGYDKITCILINKNITKRFECYLIPNLTLELKYYKKGFMKAVYGDKQIFKIILTKYNWTHINITVLPGTK